MRVRAPSLAPCRTRRKTGAIGAKKCTKCGVEKPLDAFYFIRPKNRPHSWCKSCKRITVALYKETEAYKAWSIEYNRRPEVRERKYRHKRESGSSPESRLRTHKAQASVLVHLLNARRQARYRLNRMTDPVQIVTTMKLIDAQTKEIDRIRSR